MSELKLQENESVRVYGANDVDSLQTLKLSCKKGEIELQSKIVSVQLALVDDNIKATAVIYQEIDIIEGDIRESRNLGHIIFSTFTTDVDKQAQIALHKTQGEKLACEGKAYIKNQVTNVLVFREKLK